MSTEDKVRDFLAKGGTINKVPTVQPKPKRRKVRRGKWRAAKSFKAGGRLS